jgi:hypothetical protein
LLLAAPALEAQLQEPNRVRTGLSLGVGGVHAYLKPSFDVHYRGTELRLAPGPFYLSGGLSQRIAYFKPMQRRDRPIYLHAYYHNDVFLSHLLREAPDDGGARLTNRQGLMALIGLRANLNYRKQMYVEGSIGALLMIDQFSQPAGANVGPRHTFLPMLEFRLGGLFVSHKVRHVQAVGEPTNGFLGLGKLFGEKDADDQGEAVEGRPGYEPGMGMELESGGGEGEQNQEGQETPPAEEEAGEPTDEEAGEADQPAEDADSTEEAPGEQGTQEPEPQNPQDQGEDTPGDPNQDGDP